MPEIFPVHPENFVLIWVHFDLFWVHFSFRAGPKIIFEQKHWNFPSVLRPSPPVKVMASGCCMQEKSHTKNSLVNLHLRHVELAMSDVSQNTFDQNTFLRKSSHILFPRFLVFQAFLDRGPNKAKK